MGVAFLPPLFHRYNQTFFAKAIPYDQLRLSWSRRMSRAAGSYRRRHSLAEITLRYLCCHRCPRQPPTAHWSTR